MNGTIIRAQCPCGCGIMVGPFEIVDETVDCEPDQLTREIQRQSYAAFYERCVRARLFQSSDVKIERCRILERQRQCLR